MENKYDCIKLDKQLCFPLYAVSKEIIKKYKKYLDTIDLTYTQYITMMVLWEKEELTSKELGRFIQLDSGTLTPVLKKLEDKNYLKRSREKGDERNLLITITDLGISLKDQAIKIPESIVSEFNITEDEAITLYKILYKILGANA